MPFPKYPESLEEEKNKYSFFFKYCLSGREKHVEGGSTILINNRPDA